MWRELVFVKPLCLIGATFPRAHPFSKVLNLSDHLLKYGRKFAAEGHHSWSLHDAKTFLSHKGAYLHPDATIVAAQGIIDHKSWIQGHTRLSQTSGRLWASKLGYCRVGGETSTSVRHSENLGGEQCVGPRLGAPRVKCGTEGCNPTLLAAGGGIGYIVK